MTAFFLVHCQHLLTVSTQGNRGVRSLWGISVVSPLSMKFPRQEYWSGLAFPSPVDLPNPGIEPAFPALASGFFTTVPSRKPLVSWRPNQIPVQLITEFQWSYFKSWKMMLWKCCTQYVSKSGKLSSGHRTAKGQFSCQSQRKATPKNAQTTAQLHSSHMLVK